MVKLQYLDCVHKIENIEKNVFRLECMNKEHEQRFWF